MWERPPSAVPPSAARRHHHAPPRSDKGLIVYNFCMSSQPQKPATTNEWQIQEIHTAITEADAGDFATDAEVQVIMDKWNVDIG
jgi:hypothetical protein